MNKLIKSWGIVFLVATLIFAYPLWINHNSQDVQPILGLYFIAVASLGNYFCNVRTWSEDTLPEKLNRWLYGILMFIGVVFSLWYYCPKEALVIKNMFEQS